MEQKEEIEEIEKWKTKRLVKSLSSVVGLSNTSMITLAIPPSKSISHVNSMLTMEYGTASNIKSRVNKLSVLSAITSVQHKLKQYKSTPPTGLVIYCGSVSIEGNKEKKMNVDIVPYKSINKFVYLCDNRFHTEVLEDILDTNEKFGFIIMDGNGVLYGLVYGNEKSILHKFGVDLPKKHRKGGQSALRFSRLREEARNNYIRKVAELSVHYYIDNDIPNVNGLILAGNADLKTELSKSPHFDPRLKKSVIQLLDINYGGLNGFNQAIELSSETLSNLRLVKEKKLLDKYFHEIATDSGKYCFGIKQTIEALEQGSSEHLIIWEDCSLMRYTLIDFNSKTHIHYIDKGKVVRVIDELTGQIMEIKEAVEWVSWIAENYKQYGTKLDFITDRTTVGTQFVKGFGGIGCILRWNIQFEEDIINLDEYDNEYSNEDEYSDLSCDIDDFL